MHVAADLNWFLQFVVFAVSVVWGLLYLVRDAASRYFVVDSNFDSSAVDYTSLRSGKREKMTEAGGGAGKVSESCAACGLPTTKQCSRCKMVKYCSEVCQINHWKSDHKAKCSNMQSFYKAKHKNSKSILSGRKVSLVPAVGSAKILKQSNKILFPYEEFVEFFNCDRLGYPPCGLLNCGNSCFANVVLQCLAYTKPLVAYLLEKGHRIECQRDDWCFLCEFQTHVERASQSLHPFSPMNILSRLPNIGGNLGYGKQEDAHEFMRFAIDTMQSVCLDEFGGEKAVHPIFQVTTLIQHIFGGRLRSQVICAECNNISNQFENMMDLTVEIHGDAGSLEECLDQFTAEERLHGDNMYKCDGCNAYVTAWKRLTVQRSPNILTIALKRFQSGRFGKLNKRVTFPETLDLRPYMSELEDGNDVYKLYAVIVHVDMLNASFFGHYICYVKDFRGNWYRIDDCKVDRVELDEVLSQGAYMLLYSRIRARSSCLIPAGSLQRESNKIKTEELHISLKQPVEYLRDAVSTGSPPEEQSSSENSMGSNVNFDEELIFATKQEATSGNKQGAVSDLVLHNRVNVEIHETVALPMAPEIAASPVNCASQISHSATLLINKMEGFHSSLKQPAECLLDAVCSDNPLEFELSSSENSSGSTDSMEELMFTTNQEDTSGDEKGILSDLVLPTGMIVEIHETLALPIASEGAASPVNCANHMSHSATLSIDKVEELHTSLKQPAECGLDAVCLSDPLECKHPSSENCQGSEVNLEEELIFIMNQEGASGYEKGAVDLVLPTGMNLDIHEPTSSPIVSEEVGSVNYANPISHSATLSISKTSAGTYAHDSKLSSSISHVNTIGSETRNNVNGSLLGKPTEESSAIQNSTFLEVNIPSDFSARYSTTSEVQDDVNSAHTTSMNGNGLLPSVRTRSAVEKSNGERSSTELKPLFPTGFLVKPPRRNSVKLDDRASTELNESVAGLGDLLRKLTEESTTSQSFTFMDNNNPEVQDVVNSAHTTSMSGNGLLPSDRTQGAVEKSNGESSSTELKPLFSPGFLVKPPRRNSVKLEDRASTELNESVAGLGNLLGKPTEEFTSSQNFTFMDNNTPEVQDVVNSAHITSMNGNGLLPSDRTQGAVEKSNGESSSTELKPLFSPGFLVKPPRRNSVKLEDRASTELNESVAGLGNLLGKPTEESTSSQNFTFMDDNIPEVQDDVNSAHTTSMDGDGLLPSDRIGSDVEKPNVESSCKKFKPLFQPGFLIKPVRRNSINPEDIASAELIESIPGLQQNNYLGEVSKSHLSCENRVLLNGGEKPKVTHGNRTVSIETYNGGL